MNKTHIGGSTLIDLIAASLGLLECIDGSKLMDHNNIVLSDHREYIVDMNFKAHFDKQLS